MCEALRAAGVEVWFDQNELVGGDAWDAKIRGQISSCALFVPLISANTQARLEGYFRLEWKLAAQRTHTMADEKTFLLPVVIDATRDAEAKVPAEFKMVQWTKLPGGGTPEKFCARVKQLLGGESVAQASSLPAVGAALDDARGRGRAAPFQRAAHSWTVPAILGVGLIVALAAYFALRPRRSPEEIARLLASAEAAAANATAKSAPAAAAVPSAPPDDEPKSVAVLAFADNSLAHDSEYFSDGISEELINALGKVPGLKVPARTSSFYFKGKSVPVPDIAKQLGVAYVIEGSVQRAGDKVKISARLSKAADGFQVWADSFTRDAKDVFAVEEEIAGLIAKQLSLKLGTAAGLTRAVNPEAMELYLRGRQSWALRTRDSMGKAEELFLRAIALQPDFARAHAGLADAWWAVADMDGLSRFKNRRSHDWDRIIAKFDEVAALDPSSADCFAARGEVASLRGQFAEADQLFRRALELNPNHASAHQWYGRYLSLQGRMDEALVQIDAAIAADPFAPRIASNAAMIYVLAGRPNRGLELAERSLALQSGNGQGIIWKAEALVALGRIDDLVRFVRTTAGGDGAPVGPMGTTFLAQVGRLDQPRGETPLRGFETGGYVDTTTYNVIRANLVFGRRADALTGLDPDDASYAECEWMAYLPLFDQIRNEPAFRRFYDEVGLGEAHARAQAWRQAHPPESSVTK